MIDPVAERRSKTRDLGKQAIKRLGEPEEHYRCNFISYE
jgi:hypothetical protein